MIKTFTISANHEAVVPTGPYENQRFGFGISETLEWPEGGIDLKAHQIALGEHVYNLFKQFEQKAIQERIEKERKDFRWGKLPNGDLVPSVTTFLNYDADFFMSPQLLQEYASQGSILEKQGEHYFVHKEWITDLKVLVDKYPELWVDYVIVSKGQVAFDFGSWNLPAFLEKYPFISKRIQTEVVNEEDRYVGHFDIDGMTGALPGDLSSFSNKLTIADYKRTPDKVKNFCQMACYAVAERKKGIKYEQMMIIPANPDNKQGFSKPIFSAEIDKYYKIAMRKRQDFKKRYGI